MRFLQVLSFAIVMMMLSSGAYALNPQPEPPGKKVELNPQPEPPGVTDSAPKVTGELNPQPEPPGIARKKQHKRKPALSSSSDSHGEADAPAKKRNPALSHGSDSSENKTKQPPGPPVRDTGADDMVTDPTAGIGPTGGR